MWKLILSLLLVIGLIAFMGCDSDDYKLDERVNPYDPEIKWGSEIIGITPLTQNDTGNYPSWSRDGAKIAYYDRSDLHIHVMDAEGKDDEELRYLENHDWEGWYGVKWSPAQDKADQIAYIHGPGFDISVREYPDKHLKQLTRDGNCVSLAWSPDGEKIAYVRQENQIGKLKIVDIVSEKIDDLNPVLRPGESVDRQPIDSIEQVCDWSPDGGQLMVKSIARVYKVDVDRDLNGNNRAQLLPVEKEGLAFNAVWSRHDSSILYVSFNFGRYEIWMIKPNGNQAAILTRDTMIAQEEQIFRVLPEFHPGDLDNHVISDDMRKNFALKGLSLSANTTVLVEQKGNQWQIIDSDSRRTYTVRKEEDLISIYGQYTKYAEFIESISWSPGDESKLLFVGSADFHGSSRDIFLLRMELR